jgi:hypothetical protein
MTMDEIVRTLQEVLGKRRPIVHQPAKLMKIATWPMRFLPTPMLSPDSVDFITQEVEIDPGPAQEFFGFPFRTLAEGLREYL